LVSFAQLHAGRDEPILDPDLPIIDAHHHLLVRPGLRYLLDDYLADAKAGHRIVASVYMEVLTFARRDGPELLRPLGEVEFANGVGAMCAGGYSDVQVCAGIVGQADMRAGDAVAELLDRALEAAPERLCGVRQIAIDDPTEAPYRYITNRPPRSLYRSPGFRPALRQVVQRGLAFDIAVFHHQLHDVIDLADAFPDATLVLGHCGHAMAMDMSEQERDEVFRALRASMIELGRRPNVYCKIGGLGLPFWGFKLEERSDVIGSAELAALWRPFVETSIEAFGAQRCMMESNYPIDGRSAGFVPLWNALKRIVHGASPEEKAALFHRSVARAYRLRLPEGLLPD
jgi:L-fuconolactonase